MKKQPSFYLWMLGLIVVFACNIPSASTPTPDLLATLSAVTPLPANYSWDLLEQTG
jgi:hypothetical protein